MKDGYENRMPVASEMVGEDPVAVLRDTGCSGVIVKRSLVNEEQMTVKVCFVMIAAHSLLKAPFANVWV